MKGGNLRDSTREHAPGEQTVGMIFIARRHDDREAIESMWRAYEAQGGVSAFQRLTWLRAAAESFASGPGLRPFFVEVIDVSTGKTVMLLPLVRRETFLHVVIEFLGWQVSDISAPIMAPLYTFPTGVGKDLWDAIVTVLPSADLIQINHITTTVHGRLNPLCSLPYVELSPTKSFEVEMNGDAETIVNRLANNQTRRILKTSARRLAERGNVRLVAAATREEVEVLHTVMVHQRRERFNELGRVDHLALPGVSDFYKNAALSSLGAGPAQMFGLSVDGEWIATTYTLIQSDTIHLTIVTMAGGAWQPCSPGMTILARYMQWARARGLTVMDFSIGDTAYKTGFGGIPKDRFTLLAPLTAKGKAIVWRKKLVASAKEKVKSQATLSRYARAMLRFYRAGRNKAD